MSILLYVFNAMDSKQQTTRIPKRLPNGLCMGLNVTFSPMTTPVAKPSKCRRKRIIIEHWELPRVCAVSCGMNKLAAR